MPLLARRRASGRAGGGARRAVRGAAGVAAAGVAAALVWWEGGLRYGTPAARASVAVAIAAAAVTASVAGAHRQRQASRAWLAGALRVGDRPPARSSVYAGGVLVWVALLGAVLAWDLYSFLRQAQDLPTLSRLLGRLTDARVGRAALAAVWLATGGYLALGWRRRRAS